MDTAGFPGPYENSSPFTFNGQIVNSGHSTGLPSRTAPPPWAAEFSSLAYSPSYPMNLVLLAVQERQEPPPQPST